MDDVREVLKKVKSTSTVATFIDYETGIEYPVNKEGYNRVMAKYCTMTARIDDDSFCLGEVYENVRPVTFRFRDMITHQTVEESNTFMKEFIRIVQSNLVGLFTLPNADFLCVVSDSTPFGDTDGNLWVNIKLVFPRLRLTRRNIKNKIYPPIVRALGEEANSNPFVRKLLNEFDREQPKSEPLLFSKNDVFPTHYQVFEAYDFYERNVGEECALYIFDRHDNSLYDYPKHRGTMDENVLLPISSSIFFHATQEESALINREFLRRTESVRSTASTRSNIPSNRRLRTAQSGVDRARRSSYSTSSMYSRIDSSSYSSRMYSKSESETPVSEHIHNIDDFVENATLIEESSFTLTMVFAQMWKIERMMRWEDWRLLGQALFDSTDGDICGRNAWQKLTEDAISATRKLPIFFQDISPEKICRGEWGTFQAEKVTYKDIAWIARDDSPEKFKVWHDSWCKPAGEMATSCDHYDVAVSFYRRYFLEFICYFTGAKPNWLFFHRGKLRECPAGYALRTRLSSEFASYFRHIQRDILVDIEEVSHHKDGATADTVAKINKGDEIIVRITKLIHLLKSRPFKSNIVSELADLFVNQNIPNLMGSNGDLLGTPNGVFVVNSYDIYHRPARPGDYISQTIGPIYDPSFTKETEGVKFLYEWARKTFHDKDLIKYWWKVRGSMLRGGNRYKKIYCHTGHTNNSKSAWEKLDDETFKDYCDTIPASKFQVSFENPEGPSPLMASLKDKRPVYVNELDPSRPLKDSMLKLLTSDKFKGRHLHSNFITIKPLFVIIMIANDPPPFERGRTKAIEGRYECFYFGSTWDSKAPKDVEEQERTRHYPVDSDFDDSLPKYSQYYLWILVESYKKLIRPGSRGLYDKPKAVIDYTKNYWDEKDWFNIFLVDTTEDSDCAEDYVTYRDLYDRFKSWYREFYEREKIYNGQQFKTEMCVRWKKPTRDDKWYGKKIRIDNERE